MKDLYTYGMQPVQRNLTIADLQRKRGQRKFTQVTADTVSEAAAAAAAGIDTLSCGLDEYDAVRAGAPNMLIITALPVTDYISETEVVGAALRVMEAGSDAVFTARGLHLVEAIARENIPVMSHIGMSPRKSTQYGGLLAQGKTADSAMRLLQQFHDLENAGAFGVEVELIAAEALKEISQRSKLVTFNLGCGSGGDVVFLYSCDILGEAERVPRHAKAYADLRSLHDQVQSTRIDAYRAFQAEVVDGSFPQASHSVKMPEDELEEFRHRINEG